tara:strand:+ start:53 stop:202 length:150 start_codon:yes stop_codon:yes gene_type:complete
MLISLIAALNAIYSMLNSTKSDGQADGDPTLRVRKNRRKTDPRSQGDRS